MSDTTEPFPILTPNTLHNGEYFDPDAVTRRRRKSSNLGGDPRGDTGTTSLATSTLSRGKSPLSQTTNVSSKAPSRTQSKRKKAKGLFSQWKRISLKYTWLNPLLLIIAALTGYYVAPGEQNPLHPALFLSYANPAAHERTDTLPAHVGDVTQYGKGRNDFIFVGFYIIVFTFTREFLMQQFILPIARACGIKNKGKQARFMEQFYTAIYFGVFGPFGLFVMSRTPVWFFNTAGMYEGFPHRAHEAYFKAYYLLQAAYWAQQGLVLILLLEKPRKDFKELVLHHIITIALIWCSYRFHFTYMGVAVYITHDVSDFFLATSKLFNYLDLSITGVYYTFFIGVWAYTRHYLNLRILFSMLPGGQFETVGPYEINWETQQYKCLLSQSITSALLTSLQLVNIFWFFLILRIFFRYAFAGVQKDERSDDEDADEVEEEEAAAAEDAQIAKRRAAGLPTPSLTVNGEPVDTKKQR